MATVKLNNVVLSFPALFQPRSFDGQGEAKYSSAFILDKKGDDKQIQMIRQAADQTIKDKWGAKVPSGIKLCLRDGSEKDGQEGYGDNKMFLTSSSKRRPQVVDRKRQPLTEQDDAVYPGVIVNAVVELWAQDNKFGKRINAELRAVQIVKDGTPLGGAAPVRVDEVFDEIEDEYADVM